MAHSSLCLCFTELLTFGTGNSSILDIIWEKCFVREYRMYITPFRRERRALRIKYDSGFYQARHCACARVRREIGLGSPFVCRVWKQNVDTFGNQCTVRNHASLYLSYCRSWECLDVPSNSRASYRSSPVGNVFLGHCPYRWRWTVHCRLSYRRPLQSPFGFMLEFWYAPLLKSDTVSSLPFRIFVHPYLHC